VNLREWTSEFEKNIYRKLGYLNESILKKQVKVYKNL